MAKLFRTSGTGSQQQTLDTTDEKIKIYADDTALDTDLTNIPDGEIVATKESTSGGDSGYVGEIPLGTWAGFESDTAPNSEWLQAGTTFDANVYPALAMMLGGNTVPSRFDHNRLGDWETATISGDSNNPTVMQYDGYLTVKDVYTSNNGFSSIFVDGVSVNQVNMAGATGDAAYNADGTLIPFKKGQSIYIHTYNTRGTERHIAYYTHPLFIKATPTSSDSDYEGTLNEIRTYVSNSNSYSTEETPTGGTWIDGKPIYRIAVEDTNSISASASAISSSAYAILSTKNINMVISACWNRPASSSYNSYYVPVEIEITSSSIKKKGMSSASGYAGCYLIIEYTKTTD